jgi:hypothetical protein
MGANMLKVYIAAPWKEKVRASAARQAFIDAGITVTSRWIDVHEGADPENEAIQDIQDIYDSDGMVILQYRKSEGKAFEQGLFLGLTEASEKWHKMIVVNPKGRQDNVFQYMTSVYTVVKTVDEAIAEVLRWERTAAVTVNGEVIGE